MGTVGSSPGLAANLGTIVTSTNTSQNAGPAVGWRPPQWAPNAYPPLTLIAADPVTNQQTAFVFDAIIRAEHSRETIITRNPVQTGPPINDNAYVEPSQIVAEIRMSDSMQSYTVGQWADSSSRSVSAFHTLYALQSAVSVMQLATRLNFYGSVMIKSLRAPDDVKTKNALRAIVTFEEIITANQVEQTSSSLSFPTSEIPQSTDSTNAGPIQTTPVPTAIQIQNNIASTDQ